MELRTDPITKLLLFLIFLALVAHLVRPFFLSKDVAADSAALEGGYIATEAPAIHIWKIEGQGSVRLIARGEALSTNVTRGETTYRVTRGMEELR